MLNENILRREIVDIINEELSISDNVKWKAKVIAESISELIRKVAEKEKVADGVYKSHFDFSDKFLEKNIEYSVNFYNFANRDVFNRESVNLTCGEGTTVTDGKRFFWVTINCYGISGSIVFENLCDTVQHELSHVYQAIAGNKRITTFDGIYAKARTFLGSSDIGLRSIAEVVYFSYCYEQDGFINGLYAELMSKGVPSPRWSDLKDTGFYSDLTRFLNAVEYVSGNEAALSGVCRKEFGLNIRKVVENGKIAERRIKEKIGKVLIKIRKDYEEEGVRFLSDTKGNTSPYLG